MLKAIGAKTRASQFAAQLRDRFTREPKGRALVGWQGYYRAFLEQSPGRALIDHRGPYVGDELRQTELINSMVGGRMCFLISAPPGCGKSRFALELARQLGRLQRSWDVRFVRHDEPTLREELHEITQSKRLVLIVDDAQDCPALVQELASVCAATQRDSQVHLVCLSEPAGRVAVAEALTSQFPIGEPLEVDLGRPAAKLLRELIDQLIPQLSPHHRDVIRRFVADSFAATVLLCSSVARQKSLPQTLSTKNLREFTIRQPIVDAVRDLCSSEKALRALAVYAACAPVRCGDPVIRVTAAAQADLPTSDVEVLERRVLENGLFQADARGCMRPVPNLIGNLILEEACLDEQGRSTSFGKSLLGALFEQQQYEPVVRNCGDLARLFSASARVDFLSELILERANSVSAQNPGDVYDFLESCSSLATRQPKTIVHLIDALAGRGLLRAAPAARELSETDSPEIRAQLLMISAGEHDPSVVPRALEYSRQLLACARPEVGTYRAVHANLARSCQFALARPLGHATAVLEVLKGWAEGPDLDNAELAGSLVAGFLKLEMYSHRWERDVPTAASVRLNPTDEIWKLRARALEILTRCAGHAAPAVQHAAADSLEHWARGYRNLTDELRERWAPQIDRELDTLAERFSALGSTTQHLPVRAAIERQGWRWWTEGPEVIIQQGGKRILDALAEANTYALWKALHDATLPAFPVPTDESVELQKRREGLLALIEPSVERRVQLARELFDRLDPLYKDSAAWSAAFTSVLNALPRQALQPGAHLYLAEFVRRHPAAAWSFLSEEAAQGPLGAILPALLAELRAQDPVRWRAAIEGSLPGTRLFQMQLGALCAADELNSLEREMVSRGLELEDAQAVHLSARALLNANRSALAPGLAAVLAVLPRRAMDQWLWELTLDAFARWGEHVLCAPEGEEEPGQEMRAISGELLRLLRTYGNSLSWKQGPGSERLATVVAIFAVAIPHTLRSSLREFSSTSVDQIDSELPLSRARLCTAMRLLRQSSTAVYWQKQFVEWIADEPDLAMVGAECLAQLCGPGTALDSPSAALEVIDRLAQNGELPSTFRETLARARQGLQAAIEDELLGDQAN